MVRRLIGALVALAAVGLAYPGAVWAAETVTKAACGCCFPSCCR